ncbi:DUF397 domain-containing protein [Nocardia sp. NPDC051570]|uniref:DUF397 domain-containing protein n=1 Tax=Nocardia sp. NPDC051570 TaxID=3364324 RepID=UPI0037B278BE
MIDLSAPRWFKSSRSNAKENCVEVAHLPNTLVAVWHSKNPTAPALLFTPTE